MPAAAIVGQHVRPVPVLVGANVAPSGRTAAGEVEDYRVLVLSDKPVANPDNFEVAEGVIREPLNVLANDFASSTGVLAIVGRDPAGTRQRADFVRTGSRCCIRRSSAVSPPVESFTYTISDGTGATSTATVTVFVRAEVLTPIAVDDTYRVTAGATGKNLNVLVNDLPGVLGTMQITSVTIPTTGTAVLDNNGTPSDPLDDFIVYTPSSRV